MYKFQLTKSFVFNGYLNKNLTNKKTSLILLIFLCGAFNSAVHAAEITTITPESPSIEVAETATKIVPEQSAESESTSANSPDDVTSKPEDTTADLDETDPSKAKLTIDPNSLAADNIPTVDELSEANQSLLTNNANLQRNMNDLETQVNVLINERSGQLFLYGALTVVISFLAGIMASLLLLKKRNDRW